MILNKIYNNSIVDKTKKWLFASQERENTSTEVLSQISHTTQKIKGMASSYGHKALKSGAIVQLAESAINTCFPQLTVAYSLASTAVGLISQDPQTEEPKKEEEKKILKIKGMLLVGCIALSGVVSQALSYGVFDASYAQPLFTLMLGHLGSTILTTKDIPSEVFLGGNKGGVKDSVLFRAFQRELTALSCKGISHLAGIQGNLLINTILPYTVKNYVFHMNPLFSQKTGINYQDAGEILKLYYPSKTLSNQLPSFIQQFPPLKQLAQDVLEIGIEKKVAMNILTRLFNDYSLLLQENPIQMTMEKLKQVAGEERATLSHHLALLIENTIATKSQWMDKFLWSRTKSHIPSLNKEDLDTWMRSILPGKIDPKMLMDQDITAACLNHFIEFAVHQLRSKLFQDVYKDALQEGEIHLFYKNLNGLLFMKMPHVPFTNALLGHLLSLTQNFISKTVTRALDIQETIAEKTGSSQPHSSLHEEKEASIANIFLCKVTTFVKRLQASIQEKEAWVLSFYELRVKRVLIQGIGWIYAVQSQIKEQLKKLFFIDLFKTSLFTERDKAQNIKLQKNMKKKSLSRLT